MIAVHVAQLLQAPVGTTRSYQFSETVPELQAEAGVQGPVDGSAKLVRTTHGILVDCSYHATIDQECGRCLGTARGVVNSRFTQEFLPSTNVYTGLPEEIVADPEEPRIAQNHILDLTDEIRQDIVLQQPIRPLCRPDCAGLCPTCGENLNEARCDCAAADMSEGNGALGPLGELLRRELPQT